MSVGLVAAALGLAEGARHAFEPDHLAALSTLAQERPGARDGLVAGVAWGLGHTTSLVLLGGALTFAQTSVPPRAAAALELAVGGMLVALGARALRRAAREGRAGERHGHHHGAHFHVHAAPVEHLHAGRWTLATRPLLVGLVHGLAGSGAVSALVLSTLPDTGSRLGFIGLFGAGSVLAMGLLSAALGTPLARLMARPGWEARLAGLVGLLSLTLGGAWGLAALRALVA